MKARRSESSSYRSFLFVLASGYEERVSEFPSSAVWYPSSPGSGDQLADEEALAPQKVMRKVTSIMGVNSILSFVRTDVQGTVAAMQQLGAGEGVPKITIDLDAFSAPGLTCLLNKIEGAIWMKEFCLEPVEEDESGEEDEEEKEKEKSEQC